MADGAPPRPKPMGWWAKTKERLKPYRPRFRDRHFWIIQGLIIAIVTLHSLIEADLFLTDLESSIFVPVTLFFLPVIYAAWKFGFAGSVSTALWVTVITIPNLVFMHHGLSILGESIQLLIVDSAGIILGYWVDLERIARQQGKAYAIHLVNAQEEERQRIARDLHDDSLQSLILLCQELDDIKNTSSLPKVTMEKVGEARKTAERTATGLRDFTRGLRPPILNDLGMVAAIRKLLLDFMDRNAVEGQSKTIGKERRLPLDLELGLFRIAQEALSNVERHARAANVAIMITFEDKEICLDIRDDGIGFSVPVHQGDAVSNKLGLIGMVERAEQLGGKLEIQSSPGKGTRIRATIPLPSNGVIR